MPKVICVLPNASTEINGVKFSPVDEGMVSEEITAEQADAFTSITGYKPYVAKKKGSKTAEITVTDPVVTEKTETDPAVVASAETTGETKPAAE